jgi:hypothetical protein
MLEIVSTFEERQLTRALNNPDAIYRRALATSPRGSFRSTFNSIAKAIATAMK